jgi:hypothetical protein
MGTTVPHKGVKQVKNMGKIVSQSILGCLIVIFVSIVLYRIIVENPKANKMKRMIETVCVGDRFSEVKKTLDKVAALGGEIHYSVEKQRGEIYVWVVCTSGYVYYTRTLMVKDDVVTACDPN